MQLGRLQSSPAAAAQQCPNPLPVIRSPLHAPSMHSAPSPAQSAAHTVHQSRHAQRSARASASSAPTAGGSSESYSSSKASTSSPVAAAASRHMHLLDNLEQLDTEANAFAPSFLEELRVRTARLSAQQSRSDGQGDGNAHHTGVDPAGATAGYAPANGASVSNGYGSYSNGASYISYANGSSDAADGNGHNSTNGSSGNQKLRHSGASTAQGSPNSANSSDTSSSNAATASGTASENGKAAAASTTSSSKLAPLATSSTSSPQQQLQTQQRDGASSSSTLPAVNNSTGSGVSPTTSGSVQTTTPGNSREPLWVEWGEVEPVTDWGESLDNWFATPNQPGSGPTSYNGPESSSTGNGNGTASGYSQDPNTSGSSSYYGTGDGQGQGQGEQLGAEEYAPPPIVPSDITLLSRSAADAVLPLPPNSQQASFYQPKSLQERLIEVLGSVGASVILSKSALLAAPALLYPVWRPWIRAGLRNLQLFTTQFKCIGLWRAQLLDWEVISGGPSPYAALFGVQPVAIRLTVGDAWEGGASVMLEFPYEPRAEGLRVGEPIELLVLGTDDVFTQFKVVREVYAPESGLWLFDYPFVNRDAFLQLSLEVERARQSAQAAQAADQANQAAYPGYASAAGYASSVGGSGGEDAGVVYDLGPVGGGAEGWVYQQQASGAAAEATADAASDYTGYTSAAASGYTGYEGYGAGTGFDSAAGYGSNGGSSSGDADSYRNGQQAAGAGYHQGAGGYNGGAGSYNGSYNYGFGVGDSHAPSTSYGASTSYTNGDGQSFGGTRANTYSNGQQAGAAAGYGGYAAASYGHQRGRSDQYEGGVVYDDDLGQSSAGAQVVDPGGWKTYQTR